MKFSNQNDSVDAAAACIRELYNYGMAKSNIQLVKRPKIIKSRKDVSVLHLIKIRYGSDFS